MIRTFDPQTKAYGLATTAELLAALDAIGARGAWLAERMIQGTIVQPADGGIHYSLESPTSDELADILAYIQKDYPGDMASGLDYHHDCGGRTPQELHDVDRRHADTHLGGWR